MKTYLTLFFIVFSIQDSTFHKHLLDAKGDALCLDGTPGAYYISQGSTANKNKFVIHFEGGGWCGSSTLSSTMDSCYSRSNTALGSSKDYAETLNLVNYGFLSGDSNKNPGFYDWTRVFFKYCDGSGHQGTRSQPLHYKDKNLYFRGQNITIKQFAAIDASHHLFAQATDIIVTGGSAGGLAVFSWANYVSQKVKGHVVAIPDSGIFIDTTSVKTKNHDYRTRMINVMNISNAEVATPATQCNKAHPQQLWKCMFAQNLYQYIKVPLFAIQSLYDSWSVENILTIKCIANHSLSNCTATQRQQLEDYNKLTRAVLTKISNIKGNGVWSPACADHCYAHSNAWNDKTHFTIPHGSAYTVEHAVQLWYHNASGNHIHIDSGSWPSNSPCSGNSNSTFLQTQ